MSASSTLVSGLSGRYATALFELAQEAGQLDALQADLDLMVVLMTESEDFAQVLASPRLSRQAQGDAVRAVAKAAGASDLMQRFLGTLAANRRTGHLQAILEDARTLLAHARGEVTARVASAQALSEAQRKALKTKLQTATGRTVSLTETVDASLIGGLVVQMGSRQIDASVKTKLARVEQAMKGM